jgi:2-keto-4-pentenoate hydratase/2-oxohepta-3-ene-1,7-dioic acid hydratase in catechol pathway
MKLLSCHAFGTDTFGVVLDSGFVDARPIAEDVGYTLAEAISRGALERLGRWAVAGQRAMPLTSVAMLPVIPNPGKILCVGINYMGHVKETGRDVPQYPMLFTRFADSQTAHGSAIVRPTVSSHLDFEGELAVIIGKLAWRVKARDALTHVAGYSCYNDGTLRDWQRHTIQFTPGKNFPRTGGFGPWMVTPDEVGDVSALTLTTRLNGEVTQSAPLSDLIFNVPALIEYCSSFTVLRPGDVIVTGTPGGVGAFRQPPLWMKPGDLVEVEISKIGMLRNTIADEIQS